MTDGDAIARERIAREANERTGSLDLGMLGLTVLPDTLFALKHLRRLNLGSTIFVGDWRSWVEGSTKNAPNDIESSLARLIELPELEVLSLSGCRLTSLTGIAALPALRQLHCSRTSVSDLAPVERLTTLQELYCFRTSVSDLRPLEGLTALQSLDCFSTGVSDLEPLAKLATLQSLACSSTGVSDLAPLAGLPALQRLDCSECVLTDFPQGLLFRSSLEELILFDCRLPDVPAAVLSQSSVENCLESLRAHVRDLQAGTVPVADVKLMVLGNGRVGKTQLCRRLRGENYDEGVASTHGIMVTNAPLPAPDDGPPARLHIWDFGGQDIYHGTHALFMRTNAIFLLAWTTALEDAREYEHDGMIFRNHPLDYWVHYIRHLYGKRSPVLVVQTRCDRPQDDAVCPVPEADLFKAFKFRQILRYSAKNDRGRAGLVQALAEAAAWLREREGISVIGLGRHRVQRRLEAMQDADAALPPEEARQYRTITHAQFHTLCEEAGGISSPNLLLSYLHNAGIVFYRPELFHDAIILDQNWALEAIYAVFHRGKCYRHIRRHRGRFTRSDLEVWVWRDHNAEEQKLFLSMMQSCGICFEHRRIGPEDETEYIAPDLLPGRAELQVELEQKWDADGPAGAAAFEYAMLHPGLMRSVISRIGGEAGLDAIYWKGGVYVYETRTKSRGLIEQEMIEGWRGRIRVQTQRGQAAELLKQLMALIEEEQNWAGMTSVVTTTAVTRTPESALGDMADTGPNCTPADMVFRQEPSSAPEWCVSYAWGDDTPEGRDREAIVDRLCAEAVAQGKHILRDKKDMGLGEQISKFMRRIGRADRVFAVLSDKYLKSPFCMFELSEVWRNSRQDDEEFLKRIRIYTMPDATIWTLEDRLTYAIHWKERHARLEAKANAHGYDILGDKGYQEYRRMKQFAGNVTDILATVADILQPRSFDELVQYGWQD